MKNIKKILANKKAKYAILGILALGILFKVFSGGGSKAEELLVVEPSDFVQQISVSGKVIAKEEVDLAFGQSGRVSGVYASVGDIVYAGKVLAMIENGDEIAAVAQKRASLEAARANLRALENGTRPEQVSVTESKVLSAQTSLDRARETLFDAIQNSYTQSDDAIYRRVDQFMVNPRSAHPELGFFVDPNLKSSIEWNRFLIGVLLSAWQKETISNTPTSDLTVFSDVAEKNLEQIRLFLGDVSRAVNSVSPTATLTQATIDAYRADVTAARTNIASAITTLLSAITSQKNAEVSLETAKKNLDLDKAGSTIESLAAAQADVEAKEADLAAAQARYQKTIIVAPFSGIITRVDAKVGGSATAGTSLVVLMSSGMLEVDSYIPEINIPFVMVGNTASITLDAYGSEVPFAARVVSIDPANTMRDGVSTYRAKLQFIQKDERIRAGMTANVVIVTSEKKNILSVPSGAVISKSGGKFLAIKKDGVVSLYSVRVGEVSSLGATEIISGLSAGDIVVLNYKE